MRAIVLKELRENLKWLPVGLLLIGIFAWLACPVNAQNVYNTSTANLTFSIAIGAGLYAVLLGGLQSGFDFSDRQRGFLLHRGVSLQRIIYGKVIAGAVLYGIACAGPLLCLTVWFYWKGPEFIPVRPAQLMPAMLACVGCFALHPATMLTFLREARWLGTRLLPLIATTAAAVLFVNGLAASRVNELLIVALLSLPVLLLSYWAIRKPGWSRAALLVTGAACVAFFAFIAALTVEQSIKNPTLQAGRYSYTQYGLDQTGDVWGYRTEAGISSKTYIPIQVPASGDKLQVDRPPNVAKTLPAGFEVYGLSYLQAVSESLSPFAYIEYANGQRNWILCYDSRGFLLLYKRDMVTGLNKFSGTVSKQGFHPPGEVPGERFTSNAPQRGLAATSSLGGLAAYSIWLDTQGVYQFDWKLGSLRTLLEMPIESAGATLSVPDRAPQLMLQSEGQIHHFAILDQAGSSDWHDDLVDNKNFSLVTSVPDLQLRAIATLPLLPPNMSQFYSMAYVTNHEYVALMTHFSAMSVARMAADGEAQWSSNRLLKLLCFATPTWCDRPKACGPLRQTRTSSADSSIE